MAAKIEHRIGVKAPSETVWELLSDLEGWADWNPLYPQAAGSLRIGSVLTLTLALPGRPSRVIEPLVLDWVPREQIHWKHTAMGGLVRTVRYIEIEALNEHACVVSNGEIFDGFFGPQVARRMKRSLRQGFTGMGEALRDRAEAAWQARAEALTSTA